MWLYSKARAGMIAEVTSPLLYDYIISGRFASAGLGGQSPSSSPGGTPTPPTPPGDTIPYYAQNAQAWRAGVPIASVGHYVGTYGGKDYYSAYNGYYYVSG